MEPISAISSIVGIVAGVAQLVESIHKLRQFWASLRHTPAFLLEVVDDIELVHHIVHQLDDYEQKCQKHDLVSALSLPVLSRCDKLIEDLLKTVKELQNGISKKGLSHYRALLRAADRSKIDHFLRGLERLKSTLMLEQARSIRQVCSVCNTDLSSQV